MKKIRFLALLIAAVLLFTCCALGSGETTSTDSGEQSAESNVQTNEAAKIGDVIKTDNFEFTVTKVQTAKYLSNALNIPYNASAGKEFLFVVFSFKNTTSEAHNTGPAFISSVDNVTATPFSVVGEIDGCMPLVGAVGAGSTFNAYMVWEVPEGWESFEFEYLDAESGAASQKVCFTHSETSAR